MNVGFINMRCNYESMITFGPAHSCFIADTICLFRCDLARFEGLPDLISYHISVIASSRFLEVFPFGDGELFFHKLGIALIAADQLSTISLLGILSIIGSVF